MKNSQRNSPYWLAAAFIGFAALIGLACNLPNAAGAVTPTPTTQAVTPSETPALSETNTPAPPTEIPSATPSATSETPEATATPEVLTAEVTTNAFCREGPGTVYRDITAYTVGTVLEVDGVNPERTWWRVVIPTTGGSCWISGSLLALSGNLDSAPVLNPPPTPTPTLTPTETLTPTTSGTPGETATPTLTDTP